MRKIVLIVITFTLACISLSARQVKEGSEPTKMLDIFKIHDIGVFQLRTSNYGCLGSGDDVVPQWPSLEFPKGSGIDYLFIGSIWFGAKKQRRNEYGEILYWQDPDHEETGTTNMGFGRVIDTLTTVGFDGDADMYELLPAYNPLEENALGAQYYQYNSSDCALKFYYSDGIPDYDDDGDGLIDEDPIGMIGFPYDPDSIFCFTMPYDDDGDGLVDEDGGYYGAENIMSYSYDYSPFGTPGTRWWGGWTFGQTHTPLNIAVKQESFCWPADSIAQIGLVKNTIYNMNPEDTLFDYTLGYFFDCDIGPQSWSSSARSTEDVSSYFIGSEYEFPYSYDHDGDGGLTEGYVVARIFSPMDYANYACWTWEIGDGPYDESPARDRNEKYWLMTHNTEPFNDKYTSLRDYPNTQVDDPCDTRFLYAYYGDMNGFTAPTDSSLNIVPGDSAVIFTLIFLGYSYENMLEIAEVTQQFYETQFDLSFMQIYNSSPYITKAINYGDGNRIYLEWCCQSSFVEEYQILYRDTISTIWDSVIVSPDSTSLILSGLENNTKYTIKIRAIISDRYVVESYPVFVVTSDNPVIPENLMAFPGFNEILITFDFTQTLNYNQDYFIVYKDGNNIDHINIEDDTYFINTISDTITHSYCIGAHDEDGDIICSDSVECSAIIKQNKLLIVDGIYSYIFDEAQTDSIINDIINYSTIEEEFDEVELLDLEEIGFNPEDLHPNLNELGQFSTIIFFGHCYISWDDNLSGLLVYQNILNYWYYDCMYTQLIYCSPFILELIENNGTKLIFISNNLTSFITLFGEHFSIPYEELFGFENIIGGFTDGIFTGLISNTQGLNDIPLNCGILPDDFQSIGGIPYTSVITTLNANVQIIMTYDDLNNNPDFEGQPVAIHNYDNGKNTAVVSVPLVWCDPEGSGQLIRYLFDATGGIAVDDEFTQSPDMNLQLQNYPNPMKSSTTISFSIHSASWRTKNAEIKIYNLKGQLVKQLSIGNSKSSIEWDGKDKNNKPVSSGIYFYRLETENYQSSVKKLLLLR